eukprot:357500-Chlamydomonas_euryale.AAC.16
MRPHAPNQSSYMCPHAPNPCSQLRTELCEERETRGRLQHTIEKLRAIIAAQVRCCVHERRCAAVFVREEVRCCVCAGGGALLCLCERWCAAVSVREEVRCCVCEGEEDRRRVTDCRRKTCDRLEAGSLVVMLCCQYHLS